MKYVKIIAGGLLAISGLIQLLKVINLYLTLPFKEWPVGAELGTILIMVAGIFIFKSGLNHNTKDLNE